MLLLPFVGEKGDWLAWCRQFAGAEGARVRQCGPGTEYANAIADCWELGGPLTIIEHDIWPTVAQVHQLYASSSPITTVPYTFDKGMPTQWTDGGLSVRGARGTTWTLFSGLGLIRFRAEAVRAIPLPADFRRRGWEALDRALCEAAIDAGFILRVLWPLVHHGPRPPWAPGP